MFTLDCAGADKQHSLCNGQAEPLTVHGATSSRSSAIFDLDDDGDLDIITSENSDHPQVLISDLSERRSIHFLKVKLVGTTSNRDALGALVQVHAGGRVYTQFNDGKSGYLSQGSIPLYFGLSDATRVDKIEVRWPSGQKGVFPPLTAVNRQVTLTEPNNLR